MNRKMVSAVTLTLLLTSILTLAFNIQPVKAGGTVGVKAGDWIKCTYTISGWPSGTPYPEWLKVEFLSVEGTNATIRVTMHMSDGTEQSDTMTVDVAAGGGTFQGLSGFVISANCTTGDSIYMTGYGNVTIAGETTGTYAGASRTVVYAGFSQYGTQLTYYWDKQTGVMVEASVVSGSVTATAKATETNMWQAETIYIRADGSINPPDAPISTVDNVTYTLTGNITSTTDGIVVERSNIAIDGDGYTVQGTGAYPSRGIYLFDISNVTIKNTNIIGFSYGVYLNSASCNVLHGNNITSNNFHGIYLSNSSNNIFYGNNIANNYDGIYLSGSSNNTLFGNNIVNNDLEGVCLIDSSYNNIFVASDYNDIYGNNIIANWGGIDVLSSNNNVFGNNIMYNYAGLTVYGYNNTISGNIFNGNKFNLAVGAYPNSIDVSNLVDGKPVYYLVNQKDLVINPTTYPQVGYLGLINCINITVEGLTLMNNGEGVQLVNTNNSRITHNHITNNLRGISLDSSSNNTLSGDNITNNIEGVELFYSLNNTILRNKITNEIGGISLWSSSNNIISGNNVTNNNRGVYLDSSSNNRFYHNNFINNSKQVYIVYDYGLPPWVLPPPSPSINKWDSSYPSGGNYWSDYVGVDVESGLNQDLPGSDCIGDTPYIIDANNTDHYPLMNPYGAPPPPTYSLTITTTVGGTTDPAPGTYTYTANLTVQVTAIPEANYLFDYWELDGVNIGSANPYSVYMDKDHTSKAVFVPIPWSPHPPPLSASISPLSASILVGQSVAFTSTVHGGYAPYSYQWYLNGAPVSGATSNTWTFTPTTSGIYYIYLKVTDAKANTAQSDAARITTATVPVGGYSIPIQVQTKTEPIIPYIALIAALTAIFTKLRPKTKRKR